MNVKHPKNDFPDLYAQIETVRNTLLSASGNKDKDAELRKKVANFATEDFVTSTYPGTPANLIFIIAAARFYAEKNDISVPKNISFGMNIIDHVRANLELIDISEYTDPEFTEERADMLLAALNAHFSDDLVPQAA